ncbi:oxidoreductase [Xylariomycetidae sp. FL0641]|nr:oxidoreductase [Xylariomycetidae sp. FL0641]
MIGSTRLDGIALVVGAGRGIGREAAFSLAEAGAKAVVFADKDAETAKASSEESKQHAGHTEYRTSHFAMDVRDADSVQAMVDYVVKTYARLDYAVNAAGIDNGDQVPLAETDIATFDKVMNINVRGNLLCVRAQVAAMRTQTPRSWTSRNGAREIGRGAIVNLGSANSFAGLPRKGNYTISKHAFMGVTKMAGLDHAPEGVRVNAVCPTWVRTPLLDKELATTPMVAEQITAMSPLKRAAEAEEVADTIAFLCSPAASYINGASLLIDAGLTTTVRLF